MKSMKKSRPTRLQAKWLKSIDSLGYYKAENYQIFIMWCLPHVGPSYSWFRFHFKWDRCDPFGDWAVILHA